MADMATKYGATAHDLNDPNEALAERARQAVIKAYAEAITEKDAQATREMEFILGGLLVGVAQVVQGIAAEKGDRTDAAIRAAIMQAAPWAVDMARSAHGRPPLPEM